MGNIKYSTIATSNGEIKLEEGQIYEKNFDNMEYINVYDIIGNYKLYLNNSNDFVKLHTGQEFKIADFQLNSIKIECNSDLLTNTFSYYVCK